MLLRAALPLLLLASCTSQPKAEPGFSYPYRTWAPLPESAWPTLPELQTAADAGQGGALFELGDAYELGLGVKPDLAKAQELYRQAGARGEPRALVRLGWGHQTGIWGKVDIAAALDAYVAADALSCPEASLALARLFAEGADGAPKSEAMAEYWYRRCLAVIEGRKKYRDNAGVPFRELMVILNRRQDEATTREMGQLLEAFLDRYEYFDVDIPVSLLAERHLKGIGTPVDIIKAWQWLNRQDTGDLLKAQLYERGVGVPKDLEMAKTHYRHAECHISYLSYSSLPAGVESLLSENWCTASLALMRLSPEEADEFRGFAGSFVSCYKNLPHLSKPDEVRRQLLELHASIPGKWAENYSVLLAVACMGGKVNWAELEAAASTTPPMYRHFSEMRVLETALAPNAPVSIPAALYPHLCSRYTDEQWQELKSSKSPSQIPSLYLGFHNTQDFHHARPFRTPRDLQEEDARETGGLRRVKNIER